MPYNIDRLPRSGKVTKRCNHTNRKSRKYSPHYYINYPFWEPYPEPTPREINENRMWKAPCGHWVSLIGKVKECHT